MNAAIFLPNWIGDVVMATPAIRALRQHYRGARFVAVGRSYVRGVVDGAPWFDAFLALDRGGSWSQRWPAVAKQLRRMKLDLAVLFPNSFRSALVAWLAGAKQRVGFRRYGRGCLLTRALDPLLDQQGNYRPSPIIDDYNRLAQTAGCPWPGYRMELFTTIADELAADTVASKFRFADKKELICLNPGAAFGSSKYWDVEAFARLANDLAFSRPCKVLVLCGPSERELARNIAQLAKHAEIVSLADEPLSLGLTKALIRRCTALVTTDSGPRHFAAAFDRPVVSLFGPTHIAWTETYFAKAVHLQKAVPCGPCQKRVCPTDHSCMKLLKSDEVFQALQELLARPGVLSLPVLPTERKAS